MELRKESPEHDKEMFSCDCLNVIVKNQENGELNGLKININSSAVYGQAVETVEFFKSVSCKMSAALGH